MEGAARGDEYVSPEPSPTLPYLVPNRRLYKYPIVKQNTSSTWLTSLLIDQTCCLPKVEILLTYAYNK